MIYNQILLLFYVIAHPQVIITFKLLNFQLYKYLMFYFY